MLNESRLRGLVVGAWVLAALLAFGAIGVAQDKDKIRPQIGLKDEKPKFAHKDKSDDKGEQVPGKDGLPKQGPEDKPLPPPAANDDFGYLQSWTGVRIGAALQVLAVPNAVSPVMARMAAAENPLTWPDWELTLTSPLPLSEHLLRDLKDSTPVPNLTNRPLSDLKPDERAYYMVTCQALIYSHLVHVDLFEKVGEDDEHRFITFAHLWKQPNLYRGQVVPVRGRMIRLRRWEAPKLAQENGVKYFWEGWVVGPTKGVNPYCIVFVELPEGLKEAEKMDQPVRFYGYYIKRFRYDAEDAKRETHILIGPTVILEKAPVIVPATEGIFSRHVLIATGVGFFSITVIIAGLTLWFRRGDKKVQHRLASLRDKPLELGSAETDPPPHEPRDADPEFGPYGPRNST
jgi:hypothetical protein